MSRKEPAVCGGEMDATSRNCRRLYRPTAGVCRYWKNKINRRARRKSAAMSWAESHAKGARK